MSNFLVYIQVEDHAPNDVSLQCLAKARALADASGGTVACVAAGSGIGDAVSALGGYGADTVHVADDASLAQYLTTPYKAVVRSVLDAGGVSAVFFPATTEGNDLAPVLAAELGAGCVIGCDDVVADGDGLRFRRIEFDRKVCTDYRVTAAGPALASLRDGIAEVGTPDATRSAAIETVAVGAAGGAKVLQRNVVQKTVNLKDARIIVAAGAGVGNEENFAAVKQLAEKLGAEMGATRAVVDAGWLPADHQIGQTGATVRPDLYIGCGISGAVQHWVGMSEAKTIVSINTDKNAPLMKKAHYRIEGDLNAVIPKMLKVLG
jgi:electron transfer flavoprotein alpha subunit